MLVFKLVNLASISLVLERDASTLLRILHTHFIVGTAPTLVFYSSAVAERENSRKDKTIARSGSKC